VIQALDSETTDLSSRLRLAVARLQRILRHQAMGGLNLTQLSCLATVRREGPLSLGELATREKLSAPLITKVVKKLEAASLVDRKPGHTDRRVSIVSATAKGVALLDEVRDRRTAYLNRRLANLSAEEIAALVVAIPIIERLTADENI
jgi:DNA-binding MarR family transcriptional regulator